MKGSREVCDGLLGEPGIRWCKWTLELHQRVLGWEEHSDKNPIFLNMTEG